MANMSGVSYDDVRWEELDGQPFGNGVGYNGLILGDLENIVDIEGPVAASGDVTSYRGMSIGFGRLGLQTIPYSAKDVRFLAGGETAIGGALTVVGNVLTAGSEFDVGSGSSYLIGKDGSADQRQMLTQLYAAEGSPYWEPAEYNDYFVISSYDTPRRIPAARVNANVSAFFADALESLTAWQGKLAGLAVTGETAESGYGYVFRGENARQNVFDLAWPEEGSITGNLTFETPSGSLNIVRIFSGETMSISTPLWGAEGLSQNTLFVLMNAKTVLLTFPTAIYGSILAPQTDWVSLTTGGNINGNAALGGLWVQEGSGFELHWFPFVGGVEIGGEVCPECPTCPDCPTCPECPTCPDCQECPECPSCPECPICPECQECPECPTCPECPSCPECPTCPDCPTCPECPACPTCPVTSGVISGCVVTCGRCLWRVKLCDAANRQVLSVWQDCGMGCFSFEADADKAYALEVETCCHYELCLKNVGVRALSVRG